VTKKPWKGNRVRTPTVLQLEAVECGAASLAMVLGYYGRSVPLEELRYACGVSRDGSKASNLIKAARRYGLVGKGLRAEPQALRGLRPPFIVFWNFNHFVVVDGFGRKAVHLNDPATGPRKVTPEEFDEAFTGVVIAFEPGPEFRKGGSRPTALRALHERLAGSRTAFLFVVLASLGLVVPGLIVPTFSRIFVDYYVIEGYQRWLLPLLGAIAATAVVRMLLTWLREHYLLRFQTKVALAWSARFLAHVLRLPVAFFAQRFAGEIGSRLALNDRLATLVSGDLATTTLNLATIAVYATVMAQYDVVLTVIGLTFAAINLIALILISRALVDAHQRLQVDEGKLIGAAIGGLQMIDSFKASGTDGLFFQRWAGYHAKAVNAEQRLQLNRLVLAGLPLFLASLSMVAILVVGGLRVMDGAITIGMLVAFQVLMVSFLGPVNSLTNLAGQLQETHGHLHRLNDVLRQGTDPGFGPRGAGGSPAGATPVRKLSGRVTVRGLTFGYSPLDPPLIEGFELALEPGARVALVGASGSGKSTIGRLIAGLYRPWSGDILFDGHPMAEIPRQELRASLAMVDQEITLFEGTLRENITLWDPSVPGERVIRAAKDAMIHDAIAERPGGYDHRVLEGGRNFSGGQKQRLEIARALVGDPGVLVLDEATSALDPTTEKAVVENMRRRGCTCIVIAHRLSTIRDCDEIVVLDRGKVVQRGTHQLLKDEAGPYRALIEN
jgi:NHLM bacteriocin system ABC transporter peptidase/ATP-binding protein